jgi:hypothetical protein
MTDREKAIASLNNALVQMHGCGRYTPEDVDELETAAWKALGLLKEQESVTPFIACKGKTFEEADTWWYACGNCQQPIDMGDRYCSMCGKAVKWE